MKNLLMIAVIGTIVWFGYGKYQSMMTSNTPVETPVQMRGSQAANASVERPVKIRESLTSPFDVPEISEFSCDGRTHCSQMRSCAEATYFIQHCPNTKMDGNNDGIPCERQWCR